jgi:cysteine synthase
VPVSLVPADLLDCIGNTPIVHMKQASEETGCTITARAEYLNPRGSIKDRIAKFIVEQAETRGNLKPESRFRCWWRARATTQLI